MVHPCLLLTFKEGDSQLVEIEYLDSVGWLEPIITIFRRLIMYSLMILIKTARSLDF